MPRLVLASASPRRRMLLEREGLDFDVRVSQADETLPDAAWENPADAVVQLATRKAQAVAESMAPVKEAVCVVGADTVVAVDGVVFGKPTDKADARRMLQTMAGRAHQVLTGVAVWKLAPEQQAPVAPHASFCEESLVFFKPLDVSDINAYLACGESLDKAGAYAIQGQGAALVDHYEGDWDNIVGLPVARLLQVLDACGCATGRSNPS